MALPKLVRDNVPEMIKKDNKKPVVRTAKEGEFMKLLKEKLQEEVDEFLEVGCEEELSDVFEVMYAICDYKKWPIEEIELIREKKRKIKGKYSKRIVLERVE
jgi:predicted house-cleaning noncanonical NTP pyrophosphatase (MazG superfamily)